MSTAIKPRKWHHHPVIHAPKRALSTLLLFASFVIPVYLFVEAGATSLPGQDAVPAVHQVPPVTIPRYRDAVPVLIYHDISRRPGRFTVSPQRFADEMAALHHDGFHAISIAQFVRFLHGGRLPARPVLITFDDGLGTFWRVADPIMRKYGMRGVVYVISGQIGKHGFYYLHPDELRNIVRSGRWDVEAHTYMSHNYIPTGHGHWGPALANRMWLPKLHRIETEPEYAYRIVTDLNRNIEDLRDYGANPVSFAYPFSAAGAPSNDRRRNFRTLNQAIAQRFRVSFVDNAGQRFINRYDATDPQQLPRLEIYHDTTAASLLTRLKLITPLPPRVPSLPSGGWFNEATNRGLPSPVRHGVLTVHRPGHQWYAIYLDPSSSELWRNYRVRLILSKLGAENSGTSATLRVGAASNGGYAITVSSGRLKIDQPHEHRPLLDGHIPAAAAHHLDVAFTDTHLTVTVDRRTFVIAKRLHAHGGIGFGVWLEKHHSPIPAFTNLSVDPING